MPLRVNTTLKSKPEEILNALQRTVLQNRLSYDYRYKVHSVRQPITRVQLRKIKQRTANFKKRVAVGNKAADIALYQHRLQKLQLPRVSGSCAVCNQRLNAQRKQVKYLDGKGQTHLYCWEYTQQNKTLLSEKQMHIEFLRTKHHFRRQVTYQKQQVKRQIKEDLKNWDLPFHCIASNVLMKDYVENEKPLLGNKEVEGVGIEELKEKFSNRENNTKNLRQLTETEKYEQEDEMKELSTEIEDSENMQASSSKSLKSLTLENALPSMTIENVAFHINRICGQEVLTEAGLYYLNLNGIDSLHKVRRMTEDLWSKVNLSGLRREAIEKVVGKPYNWALEFQKDQRYDRENVRLMNLRMNIKGISDNFLVKASNISPQLQKNFDKERVYSFEQEFREADVQAICRPFAQKISIGNQVVALKKNKRLK